MDLQYRHFDIPVNERDLCFFDTETGGFELDKELLEIGAIRVKANTLEKLSEIDIKIKPERIEEANPSALEIVGYNEEEWQREGVSLRDGLMEFLEFARDSILVAHNLPFDWMHLQNNLEKHGLQPTYFYKGLDTFSLAWLMLGSKPELTKLSLKELSNHFDIDMGTHHRGIDDARSAYKIFVELLKTYEREHLS